ncbi:hypothetical protein OJ996_23250 [Luteolibacter sp. GHJ8]|uniref:Uncharacterized protein n=1 Tax=Luteolibacter rhizosphaerae TaxID=2989719 RepID=A0ABT3G9K8_9BACT|nr:hypothetical protein [Luteolibacter rhizosphaerae]MCW1916523.1 hypothetical protein [Luteolibacter rhizosphaerae]
MPLSEKTKLRLMMPFAISPIMKWGAGPGIVGLILMAIGVVKEVGWLMVAGSILAAPVFWCYFVVAFVFLPYLVFDRLRKRS